MAPRKPRRIRRRAPKRKGKVSAYNRHVGREMRAGKSMKQAAASWKGRGRKSSAKRTVRRSIRRKPKSGARRVGRGFTQQKLFKLARMAALLGPHAAVWLSAGSGEEKLKQSVKMLSGFDMATGQFDGAALMQGYLPLLATTGVTAVIPKINSMIKGLL